MWEILSQTTNEFGKVSVTARSGARVQHVAHLEPEAVATFDFDTHWATGMSLRKR